MDAVVLLSHGSVLCGSSETLKLHADRFKERKVGEIKIVQPAYLNYLNPRFVDAVASCVQAGATRIFVVPFFLVPGKFVKVDIPKAIAEAKAIYDVDYIVAEAIGFDEAIANAILKSADNGYASQRWSDNLRQAASYCLPNPQCPLYNTPDCPRHPGTLAAANSK